MTEFTPEDLMFRPGLMKGQRILITGGGTGLGKVMAEACAMLGADVVIWGRRGNIVQDTAKEIADAHGAKVTGMACDIRVPEAIHEAMDEIWADGGALTGLVNNAAGNFISRTEDLSPRGFDAIATSSSAARSSSPSTPASGGWRRRSPPPWSRSSPPGSGTAGRSRCRRRCRRRA